VILTFSKPLLDVEEGSERMDRKETEAWRRLVRGVAEITWWTVAKCESSSLARSWSETDARKMSPREYIEWGDGWGCTMKSNLS
jgi:hypothetical protein